ncbi:hypothetical protein ACFQ0M_26585 [Kitasatospora aburaviensis]
MTDALPDREPDLPSAFIDIPGVRNFRDAGGVGTLRKGCSTAPGPSTPSPRRAPSASRRSACAW